MWYEEKGQNDDIMLYSRVTIDRNINGYAFPSKMNESEREAVLGKAADEAPGLGLRFVRAEDLSKKQKLGFALHSIVGSAFVENSNGMGLMLNDDESLSIQVNRENHFRIVGIKRGEGIDDLYVRTEKLASELETKLDIAFSERLGFLTARPSEVGSGIKIFLCASIPGIVKSGMYPQLENRLAAVDWTIAPYLNETKNKKSSCLFLIYNTATLGIGEEKLFERARKISSDIVKFERKCRQAIYMKNKLFVEDQFYRAYGTMKYCRKLDLSEAFDILCWLRFGAGFIEDEDIRVDMKKINDLTEQFCLEDHLNPRMPNTDRMGIARAENMRREMEGDGDI